ncbi:MAG: hypothetical protein IKL98_07255, partial [Akkermansia sp.]|nr:hypothetical protein [Akkermansia sp.]
MKKQQQNTHYATTRPVCQNFGDMQVFFSENLQFQWKFTSLGRATLCSDVEFIAISLFQEQCSIDSERRFCTELKTMLPEQSLKIGSRRNYNARKHRLAHYIE